MGHSAYDMLKKSGERGTMDPETKKDAGTNLTPGVFSALYIVENKN